MARPKKVVEDDKFLEVNGVKIKLDSLYTIIHKPDKSAPKAYQDEGVSKTPHPYISDVLSCVWKNGRWDTGFYEGSECYKGLSKAEKQKRVADVRAKLVEPFEELYYEGATNHNNNEFWDNWGFEIKQDKPINTGDPEQLMGIYMGLLHGKLAWEDDMKAAKFNGAMFALSNRTEKVNRAEENNLKKTLVKANALQLFDNDKEKLWQILSYVGLKINEDIDKRGLNTIVSSWIDEPGRGIQRANQFNEAFEMTKTNKGEKTLRTHKELMDLYDKGLIVRDNGVLKINGQELGGNFKEATDNVMTDKKLENLVVKMLEM